MARKRDYAAEYAARQARARARGFESYYGERVRGGARARPSAAAPSGVELRRARGHLSMADLVDLVERGKVETIAQTPGPRGAGGEYESAVIDVTLQNGDRLTFRLRARELERDKLDDLRGALATGGGADVYSNASLDIFGLNEQREDLDVGDDYYDDEAA